MLIISNFKEVQKLFNESTNQQHLLLLKDAEVIQLKEQLKQSTSYKGNDDLESRLYSLTQTLMSKQNTLETVTTERNALRLQLEKLEVNSSI